MQQSSEPDILKKLDNHKRHALVGELTELMMASDLHTHYTVADIRDIFMPAINCDQFLMYRNQKKILVGFICWAFLSADIESAYEKGDYQLKPADWTRGDSPWIIEFLAPYGHGKNIMATLRSTVFADKKGSALVFKKDKKTLKKITVYGINYTRSQSD